MVLITCASFSSLEIWTGSSAKQIRSFLYLICKTLYDYSITKELGILSALESQFPFEVKQILITSRLQGSFLSGVPSEKVCSFYPFGTSQDFKYL